MNRRPVVAFYVLAACLLTVSAGEVWTETFDSAIGVRVAVAAVLGVAPTGLIFSIPSGRPSLAITTAVSLPVIFGSAIALAVFGWPGTDGLPRAIEGLTAGWGRLLSYSPPVPLRPDLAILPFFCAALACWVTIEICLRTVRVFAVAAPSLAVWIVAVYLGKPGSGDPGVWSIVWVGAVLLVVAMRNRQRDTFGAKPLADRSAFDNDPGAGAGVVRALRRVLPVGVGVVLVVVGVQSILPVREPVQKRSQWQIPSTTQVRLDPLGYIAAAKTSTEETFTVTITGQIPDGRLRMLTLDRFDGRTWSSSAVGEPSGAIEARGAAVPGAVKQELLLNQALPGVPIAGETTSVAGPAVDAGRIRFDESTNSLMVVGDSPAELTVYSLVSNTDTTKLATTPLDTSADSMAATTPSVRLPKALAEAKASIFSGASSQFGQIAKLVGYFSNLPGANSGGKFAIDPEAPTGHTLAHLEQFLSTPGVRRGTEEQFVSAAGALARAGGIPVRIAIGYQLPDGWKEGRPIEVSQRSITAWLEIPFRGMGWVPFDPMPDTGSTTAPKTELQEVIAEVVKPVPKPSGPSGAGPSGPSAKPLIEDKKVIDRTDSDGHSPWWLVLLLVSILSVVLLLPILLKRLRRHLRRSRGDASARVSAGWAETVDQMLDSGIPVPSNLTISEVVRTGQAHSEIPAKELAAIGGGVSAALYGPDLPSEADVERLWTEIEQYLVEHRRRQQGVARLRAQLSLRSFTRR